MRYAFAFVVSLSLTASAALAQITMGAMPPIDGFAVSRNVPTTLVDLGHPALSPATMTAASVRWAGNCSGAFKLKFLRPSAGLAGYTVMAERGPFDAVNGVNLVALSPGVEVLPGYLLAVTQLQASSSSCGGPIYSLGDRSTSVMVINGDIPASGSLNGTIERSEVINARASSETNVLEGVITGAGAVAGAFGAFFRTAVQLVNRDANTATGKIIFHPAGATTGFDPSLAYSLAPFSATSYSDLVTAIGAQGLGTIDVVSTSGAPVLVLTRVFNDNGPAGTQGFSEPFVTPDEALVALGRANIIMPADLANFRMNVGVRTLSDIVNVDIVTTDAAGNRYGPLITRTYQANSFEQPTLAQFLDGGSIVPNGTVTIFVRDGSGIIFYASTTDNRTNDSSIEFARRR
ncbi:MAG TPA: hypothetical protein VI670_18615 [Thermoanaerobaculia bacterium]|jgi:hypothetical protein